MSAIIAGPAGAAVQFTKQWVGGSEFLSPSFLATDPSGELYVSDGAYNASRVLQLDSAGALAAVIGSQGGDPGQFNANAGVATDSAGNIYVVEYLGDRVQEFDSAGSFIRMWGNGVDYSTGGDICTAASGDVCQTGVPGFAGGEFNHPNGIATDSSGNVYVVDTTNQRIQKFDSSGNFLRAWGFGVATGTNAFETCTVAATCHAGISGPGDGAFNNPLAIATDTAANLYVSDAGNDRIEKFDSGGSFVSKWGTSGTGAGQFNDLEGVATDASDNLYAVDFTNSNVQVFSSGGTFVRSFGKAVNHTTGGDTCTAASGDTCGAGTFGSADGQFFGAIGLAVDGSANVYVSDGSPRVQKLDPSGTFVSKVGTNGSGGPFDSGLFYIDIATDADGNVYTSDHDTSRIQKFDPVGASLNAWGSAGTGAGEFTGPSGTAVDGSGNSYVVDESNNRVEKFDSSGTFVLAWGWGVDDGSNAFQTCTSSCQAGIAGIGDGQFNDPTGLGLDSSGNVYVADTANDRVQKFNSNGTFLTKWGSHGAGNGQFDGPRDVAVDSLGNVYVTDLVNNRVQRFSSTGTFLGKWGTPGSGPGQFNQPFGITTDPQRDVYVTDYANARVQVFRPSGVFIKQWGSGGAGQGQFNGPSSIATGVAGTIYVADAGNNRVQMFAETDTTAPQTTINSGPSGVTKDPTPTFAFSSSEPAGALFECRVDSSSENAFKPCASPKTTAHLGDGLHRFDVRAIDSAGNVDATPAPRSIKVDTHRPSSTASAPATTHRSPFNVTYAASDPTPSSGLSLVELWAHRPGHPGYVKVATDHTPTSSRAFSYTPSAGAGTYGFFTRAKDKAGNYEAPPAQPDASTAFSP